MLASDSCIASSSHEAVADEDPCHSFQTMKLATSTWPPVPHPVLKITGHACEYVPKLCRSTGAYPVSRLVSDVTALAPGSPSGRDASRPSVSALSSHYGH